MDTHTPVNAVHNNAISELESRFSEVLHIQGNQKSEHASEGNDICNKAEEKRCEGFSQKQTKLDVKCLKKSPTFPVSKIMVPSSSSDEDVDVSSPESSHDQSPLQQTYSRSLTFPLCLQAPRKLISAMKGSREKNNGGSPTKLTVKWAPDVYDPVPSLVSHTVRSRKQPKSRKKKAEKKNGKKGQKSSSSPRGSSSKDKRHFRKLGGTSDLSYKSPDPRDNVIEVNQVMEGSTEFDALDVRSQDSYCGTSFLKTSVTEVHFSLTEAQ
ncbi:uncharacterized protein LOC107648191 isoform X1 [Arachis ipaensis]|uniref:uncharacterized protein LOC107648191 isoform X1 n=1 Tax=Arachis ipaensis TaxID=130454 RepID=UPI0007AF4F31|nr:uncharacterized protein LOC107648191 isoform X1 [Arachis ipaensis]XP_016207650.1 uncharacterized protein LOC107648191 isoform X1 [Arachis ipaensis]XP_016207651.1 uncharacterized protein LOC107648191 isoform X1 [Arachis ipaensis]XP_025663479.1 uncharacterized protein LOC112758906 isoform X1 [Arachis hypogaea]XP_025663480.1 uncharacterized protein LOC112758906 isoform X1 [Arachis hypogaea]XP_025663481.1 uncharacterized protein LOC112758906 isoform X1 [Arachis hypogaea]